MATKRNGNGNGRKPHYSDMPYGNGCPLCPSCFICPGPPHCAWEKGMTKKQQQRKLEIWKPFFDKKLAEQKAGVKG